jgi:SAM-dependent methyltransferase
MREREGQSEGSEHQRIESVADWYLDEQLDFDKQLIRFRYQAIRPYLRGPEGLELGPAEGEMTQFLLQDFVRLTVVEGAAKLLSYIPDAPNLVKSYALYENYEPDRSFDTIIMDHSLDFIENPVALLQRIKQWLVPGGRILVGVPNGHSIHRLVAVKMGLLNDPCDLSERNRHLGQLRVYTPQSLRADLEAADLHVVELGGVFLKPLTNQQIEDDWTAEMIHGFHELGKDFPELDASLYAVCELP